MAGVGEDEELVQAALAAARLQTRAYALARDGAKAEAIAFIRQLIEALHEALDGESLKGLPDLVPDWRDTEFAAARVRGRWDTPLDPAPVRGSGALVLRADGLLSWAWRSQLEVEDVKLAPVADDGLRAEDAENIARLVCRVLPLHVARAGDGQRRYRALLQRVARLRAALAVVS